jgi:hypothetical protein
MAVAVNTTVLVGTPVTVASSMAAVAAMPGTGGASAWQPETNSKKASQGQTILMNWAKDR